MDYATGPPRCLHHEIMVLHTLSATFFRTPILGARKQISYSPLIQQHQNTTSFRTNMLDAVSWNPPIRRETQASTAGRCMPTMPV